MYLLMKIKFTSFHNSMYKKTISLKYFLNYRKCKKYKWKKIQSVFLTSKQKYFDNSKLSKIYLKSTKYHNLKRNKYYVFFIKKV